MCRAESYTCSSPECKCQTGEVEHVNLVNIPKSIIDVYMDDGLRERGWTDEQCYDYLKHFIFTDIPREGCHTCPSPADQERLAATLRPDWKPET